MKFAGSLLAALSLFVTVISAQTASPPAAEKPQMSEEVFKNIQVLKGIPVKEFMNTMGFFSASTGLNCIDCHSPQSEDLAGYAIDTPRKQTARRMVLMVRQLNESQFGGRQLVTCYTCHRANDRAEAVPSLLDQYSIAEDDPNRVEVITGPSARKVSADAIFDKYIQALGGAAKLAALTSFTAHGTYEGYDSLSEQVPVDIYAKAPNQLTTVVHTQSGDSVTTFNGTSGWVAAADKLKRVLPLLGGDLEGAKMDAIVSFPGGLKQDFQWRTGFPPVSIDDHRAEVIQSAARGAAGTKLYFDTQTGLLLRQVRFVDTAVGVIPTQVDYSDYRDVAGVKVPFKRVITWTDGRSTIQLNQVQANAAVEAARFNKPAPPRAKSAIN
jgi:photosynthetic reaction center cytochrome c subunit